VTWGVIGLRGFSAPTMGGVYVGTFTGLISLVVEIAVIGRSMRIFQHTGVGATLQTFMLRLAVVGSLGCAFARDASSTDAYAFCLSYCGTFFVYMCWLTWRTYKMPVQYRPRSRPVVQARPVRDRAVAGGVR